jgi:hypothetical protein
MQFIHALPRVENICREAGKMTKPLHMNNAVLTLLEFVASCGSHLKARLSPVGISTASSSAPTITFDGENTSSSLEPTKTIGGIDSN